MTTGAVIGAVILEGFYVVFDRASRQVGFAQTACPQKDPDHLSSVSAPSATSSKCAEVNSQCSGPLGAFV